MTVQNRILDKRIRQLEGQHGGSPILVLLREKGESRQDCQAKWESEHGPVGDRIVLCVSFVEAAL